VLSGGMIVCHPFVIGAFNITSGALRVGRMTQRAAISWASEEEQTSDHRRSAVPANIGCVSKWRQRFGAPRLDGLPDADRKARSAYDKTTEKRVLTMLDEAPPEGHGKWPGALLARPWGSSVTIKSGEFCASTTCCSVIVLVQREMARGHSPLVSTARALAPSLAPERHGNWHEEAGDGNCNWFQGVQVGS
jgi:hypothetical protein